MRDITKWFAVFMRSHFDKTHPQRTLILKVPLDLRYDIHKFPLNIIHEREPLTY